MPHDYEPRRARPVDGGQDALKPLVLRARGRKVVVEDVVGQRDDHGDVGDLAHRPRVVGRRAHGVGGHDGGQRLRARPRRQLLGGSGGRETGVVRLLPSGKRPGTPKVVAHSVPVLGVKGRAVGLHFQNFVVSDGRHGRDRREKGLPEPRERVPAATPGGLVFSKLGKVLKRVAEALDPGKLLWLWELVWSWGSGEVGKW